MQQIEIVHPPIGCSRKNTAPLAWYSCQSASLENCDLHERHLQWNPVGHNSVSMWIGIIKAKTALDRVIEPCGWQGLGALARCQASASEVKELNSGYWSNRDLLAICDINGESSPRDLHLNAKTQLHSMTSKHQHWTPYTKQLTRQEHNPTH